jgi:hypothetical protein
VEKVNDKKVDPNRRLAVEGLGLIATQNAINAALGVLKDALSAALGTAFASIKFTI